MELFLVRMQAIRLLYRRYFLREFCEIFQNTNSVEWKGSFLTTKSKVLNLFKDWRCRNGTIHFGVFHGNNVRWKEKHFINQFDTAGLSLPPENIRKYLILWHVQGVNKRQVPWNGLTYSMYVFKVNNNDTTPT